MPRRGNERKWHVLSRECLGNYKRLPVQHVDIQKCEVDPLMQYFFGGGDGPFHHDFCWYNFNNDVFQIHRQEEFVFDNEDTKVFIRAANEMGNKAEAATMR